MRAVHGHQTATARRSSRKCACRPALKSPTRPNAVGFTAGRNHAVGYHRLFSLHTRQLSESPICTVDTGRNDGYAASLLLKFLLLGSALTGVSTCSLSRRPTPCRR